MRCRLSLTAVLAWALLVAPVHAEQTLQQRYLDIYLKINDAEHLEKQGDYRGALEDFKDCYSKLAKIHQSDPDWEKALVTHRMDDCMVKIQDLEPKAALQAPAPSVPAPVASGDTNSNINTTVPGPTADEVSSLKLQLQAVRDELQITKTHLKDAQDQLETYRTQLTAVNEQLATLKAQQSQSVDDQMGKLLTENKSLSTKLAAAQKEIEAFRTNPKSKLALAQAQLKNLQQQYDASQADNQALQNTTTTLKQQLDQAQADLVAANQKLAAAGPSSPDYQTIKRENEVMRGILTRELQEQAHRDMAKRLFEEEYDSLKLKSKVLQEDADEMSTLMTPPTNEEERQLLASLKVPGPDVSQTPTNGFSAPANGTMPAADNSTNTPTATAPTTPSSDANVASVTPPATNAATTTPPATTPDNSSTNAPAVTIVSNNTPSATTPDNTPAQTNVAATSVPPTTPPDAQSAAPTAPTNNTPDPNAPIPPNTPANPNVTVTTNTTTPPPPVQETVPAQTPDTVTKVPPAQTVYQDTTITNNDSTASTTATDPTSLSTKARLPDDMRETAQEAADLFKNQKYDESAAKYQSIIDKYPESLYAWSNLGVVRFQQGKFDDALKALQQAVKLSPTDAFSYSNLGIVYYQLNQFENAIDALNSAKALDPTDPKTHNYLGCACSQKGWQEVAEKEFRKAIELDPNFGDAHFNLALVYATSKPPSLELARREYNRALELGIAKDSRLEKLLNGTTASTAP